MSYEPPTPILKDAAQPEANDPDWRDEALQVMYRLRREGFITTRAWWHAMQQSSAETGDFDPRLLVASTAVEDGVLFRCWLQGTLLRIRVNGSKSTDERVVLVHEDRQTDSAGTEGLRVHYWLTKYKMWSAGRIGYLRSGAPLARERVLGELTKGDPRYKRILAAGGIPK